MLSRPDLFFQGNLPIHQITARTTLIVIALIIGFLAPAKPSFDQSEALKALSNCVNVDQSCQEQLDELLTEASARLNEKEYTAFLLEVSNIYFNVSDFDRTKSLINTAEDLANAINNQDLIAECKSQFALIYFYEGDIDTAIYLLAEISEYYSRKGDSLKMGRGKLFQGQLLRSKALYSDALDLYLEALSIFQSTKDTFNEANVLAEMATLYAMSDDNKKAIAYGRKAAQMFKNLNKEHRYAYVSLNLANNLNYDEKPDSAILILNQVIPIFKKDKDVYLEINALAQLSRAYYKKGQIAKALGIMEQSNKLDPDAQYISQSIYNFQMMGRMYQDIKAYPSALEHFKKAYHLQQQIGFNDELKPLLHDIAMIYEMINQSDSALKYFKEFQIVSDSLYSIEERNRLNELKETYEADLKEEQLRNNAKEIELLEQSNEVKTQRNINLVIILIVIVALTIAIISRQRNSMKLNKMLASQKELAHKAEILAKETERQKLEEDLKHRQRELANQALLIAEKNEMIRSFRSEVEKVGQEEVQAKNSLRSISRKMERAENQQGDWDKFMQLFKDVHPELWSKLAQTHEDLTHNDLRLLALMKMGFSNKEIADILHITEGGLKKARYRLRKKLDLEAEASLHQFIQNF
jgi:tetratricopeptide (TPR) repeat protein/DNA-binding CsgD family transcriptional regulator